MRVIFMPEVHVERDSRKHIKALLSGVNVTEMKQYTIEKKKKKPASQPGVWKQVGFLSVWSLSRLMVSALRYSW